MLCVAPGCRRHLADCPRDDTCECPPQQTAPGSWVCGHHADTTREHLRELPELWALLGAGSSGKGSGTDDESPQPISDRARLERQGMRTMLVTWCRRLAEPEPDGRGSPLPDEQTIIANTRRDVVRHQSDRTAALDAWRTARDPMDRARLVQAGQAAQARAEAVLDARATGADIIEALREHIDRHLAWLLNSPHAEHLVYDVDVVHSGSYRTAHPTRVALRILCSCGVRVPISTERDAIIRCPGCEEWGTLSWWRAREAPTGLSDEPLRLRDLPQYLFDVHGIVVSYAQLRHWTRAERPGQRIIPHNFVMIPPRYDPEAVALIAKSRIGRRTA
jgi:hypothetical protein